MSRTALWQSHLRGILHALRVRGLRATAAILWHQLRDRGWDRRYGTETGEHLDVRTSEAGLAGAASAMPYVPSRAHALRQVLGGLPLPRSGTFVDLGCGKGRAMILAAEAGFARIRGVELSPRLAAVARANLQRVAHRFPHAAFAVEQGDLGDLVVLPTDQVFYAFHPCERSVLGRAMTRIASSLRAHPREAWVVWQDNLAADFTLPELDGVLACRTVTCGGSRHLVCGPAGADLGGQPPAG